MTDEEFYENTTYKHYSEEGYKKEDLIPCPTCVEYPRLWIFDNGRLAKCKCYGRYESGVSAISIMEVYKRDNGSVVNYNKQDLSDAWRYRCEEIDKKLMRNRKLKELGI